MLTGQRPVSRISQFHLVRLLNQNYPRPPCALAEKLTGTAMRAWFLQIEKILLYAWELRVPPRVGGNSAGAKAIFHWPLEKETPQSRTLIY